MDVSLRFLEELALLLTLAAATAYVLSRLHVPPVLGYLAAGLLVGSGGLGIITQLDFVHALGELGVVLIMFGLGLDFEIKRLRRNAALSILAGVASVLLTFIAVNAAALLIGFSPMQALFLAAGLSICGTAVNLKILNDLGHLKREYGAGIATTIVVTDIVAVLLLTALSGIAQSGGLAPAAVAESLLKTAAFLVLVPTLGFLVVPRVLNAVARATRSREALLVTVLALCFGVAMLSQRLGFSLALGAFIVGMTASEARVIHPIEEMTKPLEHIFGTLFFFSVGLSANVHDALPQWPTVILFIVLIVATKLLSVSTVTFLRGRNGIVALASAWGMVPVGEFTFVIINEGVRIHVLSPSMIAVAVMACLATSALAVVGLRTVPRAVTAMVRLLPASSLNFMTLLQLRASAAAAVPGLAAVTGEAPAAATPATRESRRVRRQVQEIGIHAVIIITVVLSLTGLAGYLRDHFPEWFGFPLALAVMAAVLSAPSAFFIFRSGADVARVVSEALAARLPSVDARMLQGALLAASTFFLLLFLEVAFLPLVIVHLRDYSAPALVVAGSLTLILGYSLWRSIHRLQTGVVGLVRQTLATAARDTPTSQFPRPVVAKDGPSASEEKTGLYRRPMFGGKAAIPSYRTMIVSLPVPANSWLVGKNLDETGLEEQTGVTVLGIEREEIWMGRPVGAVNLEASDEIVVIGSEGERLQAMRLLAGESDE